jgi:hypothetical protein
MGWLFPGGGGINMTRLGLLFAGATLAGSIAALATPASAGLVSIGLQTSTVNSGLITDETSGATFAGISGTPYGVFNINSVSGQVGILPDLLNSSALDTTSTGGGSLNVFVTYQGITSPVGLTDLISSLTSNTLTGGLTVTEKTFVDSSNGLFTTTTPLASNAFSAIGTNVSSDTVPTGSGPYSITEEYSIIAPGAGTANDTIDISAAAPEPAAWMLMLFGVFGVGAVLRGSRNQRALAEV